MMVDWVQGFVEAQGPAAVPLYDTGRVLRLSPGGEVESEHSGSVLLEGSYDSRLLVRSFRGTDLLISGNVVKHVQGHNLFGPDDAIGLFFDAGIRIRHALGLFPSPHTWEGLFTGPRFTRLDLTRSYRFASAPEARAWIRDVAASARDRRGGALMRGDTAYLGKGSERWQFKVYHKADELAARGKLHQLAEALPDRDRLREWAQGVVRFELTLRSKELAKIDMRTMRARDVWESYYQRITWNQNAMAATAPDFLEEQLPNKLRQTVALWRSGADVRALMSRNTFYRHRQDILAALGVDIAAKPPRSPSAGLGAELDPQGWDPEPLHVYPGDLTLKDGYLL